MRGALEEDEEDEDEGVLGSVLLHSPLLVEGISAKTSHGGVSQTETLGTATRSLLARTKLFVSMVKSQRATFLN